MFVCLGALREEFDHECVVPLSRLGSMKTAKMMPVMAEARCQKKAWALRLITLLAPPAFPAKKIVGTLLQGLRARPTVASELPPPWYTGSLRVAQHVRRRFRPA